MAKAKVNVKMTLKCRGVKIDHGRSHVRYDNRVVIELIYYKRKDKI